MDDKANFAVGLVDSVVRSFGANSSVGESDSNFAEVSICISEEVRNAGVCCRVCSAFIADCVACRYFGQICFLQPLDIAGRIYRVVLAVSVGSTSVLDGDSCGIVRRVNANILKNRRE